MPIGQIRSTTGFMVEMVVQGVRLQAVMNTGTEVSVLSTQVYEELNPKSPIKRHVTLVQAGESVRRRGFIIGTVGVRLGDTERSVILYVAPLQDQMLLGMKFLHQQKAHLDLEHGTMTMGKETRLHNALTSRRERGGPSFLDCPRCPCPCHLDRELEHFVIISDIT